MAALTIPRSTDSTALTAVAHGATAVVVEVYHAPAVARQLAQLGVVPGAQILVRRSASFGGPLFVEIHGASILLARKLAKKIHVKVLP